MGLTQLKCQVLGTRRALSENYIGGVQKVVGCRSLLFSVTLCPVPNNDYMVLKSSDTKTESQMISKTLL